MKEYLRLLKLANITIGWLFFQFWPDWLKILHEQNSFTFREKADFLCNYDHSIAMTKSIEARKIKDTYTRYR